MDIKTIGVEDWLNVCEKSATYDIAQSTIASIVPDGGDPAAGRLRRAPPSTTA